MRDVLSASCDVRRALVLVAFAILLLGAPTRAIPRQDAATSVTITLVRWPFT